MRIPSGPSYGSNGYNNSNLTFGSDPKPRYGPRVITRAALATLGAAAFWYGPAQTAQAIGSVGQDAITFVSPKAGTAVNNGATFLTQANQDVRNVPWIGSGVGWAEDFYEQILKWEALSVAIAALQATGKRGLREKKIYQDLHKQGITGKGLKVGIIDSGYRHSWMKRNKPNVTFYSIGDLSKPQKPKDRLGHGTAVTNIIADAAPDAEFVVITYSTPKQEAEIKTKLTSLIFEARKDPSKLNLNEIRKIYSPMIENIANAVRKLADEGCDVINISLSVEQAVQMSLMMNTLFAAVELAFLKAKAGMSKNQTEEEQKDLKNQQKLVKRLRTLSGANHTTEEITDEIRALYTPWLEALDYARDHGVKEVAVASGNAGGHNNKNQKAIGNVNLLTAYEHPILSVVGSTNEDGEASKFTSEFNEVISPTIAMNGSGEITTHIATPNRSWLSRILSPTAGMSHIIRRLQELLSAMDDDFASGVRTMLKYSNPKGTSFASPDYITLVVMMQAVRLKRNLPMLSIDEIRDIMLQTAQQAKFSPRLKMKIEEEVTNRLTEAKQGAASLQEEFKRAVTKLLSGAEQSITIKDGKIRMERGKNDVIEIHMEQADGGTARMETTVSEVDTEAEQEQISELVALMYFAVQDPKLLSVQNKEEIKQFADEGLEVSTKEVDVEMAAELRRRVGMGTVAGQRREAIRRVEELTPV